jgi:hypothetical protein
VYTGRRGVALSTLWLAMFPDAFMAGGPQDLASKLSPATNVLPHLLAVPEFLSALQSRASYRRLPR